MSKKFDQEKYNKWDKNFSRWEDDYYASSQDQDGWLEEEYEEEDNNYESRERS